MIEGQPSRTAERVALERAAHQLLDSPKILDDPFALRIISEEHRRELTERPNEHDRSPMSKPTRAIVVVRTRVAEDELASSGATQYVILGAGLDTFAYRNPHPQVRVFEVDQPDTQAWKRARLGAANITIPASLTFVPCDFTTDSLADVLSVAGFRRDQPAVFAWLGVAMYLEWTDVRETLRFIASHTASARVIFDYALPPEEFPWLQRMFYRKVLDRLAEMGEPWKSFLRPEPLRDELAALGFTSVIDLGAEEINSTYLANRDDGLESRGIGRIAIARRTRRGAEAGSDRLELRARRFD
jgi:methyltransferase (TIGR00027 family)